ncbi:hypothetical protein MLD38_002997 [Melastoma candidum]|uniref:Uncharacterized protein n=1 Tax=Melastoma candidum TaxID=119954 RepID=A0ACB9S0X7_9MYRT|nr:hypothetical protein MLD38_002997 [Melastoma candidum]
MGSEFQRLVPGWSWEDNKKFEVALALVDQRDPRRWETVAAILGGKKSVEEVQEHYVILLQDLEVIESGCLDCELDEHGRPRSPSSEDQSFRIRSDVSCFLEQRVIHKLPD